MNLNLCETVCQLLTFFGVKPKTLVKWKLKVCPTKHTITEVYWYDNTPDKFCLYRYRCISKETPFRFVKSHSQEKKKRIPIPELVIKVAEISPDFLPLLFQGLIQQASKKPLDIYLQLSNIAHPIGKEIVQYFYDNHLTLAEQALFIAGDQVYVYKEGVQIGSMSDFPKTSSAIAA